MTSEKTRMEGRARAVCAASIGLALFTALFYASVSNYLLFHCLAELFSIVVGFAIFTVSWNTKAYTGNRTLGCLGPVYLCVAGLDLAHTLSYAGMNIIGGYEFPANQLWIAARTLEAAALAFFLCSPAVKPRLSPEKTFAIAAALTLAALLAIFWLRVFPVCYVAGQGQTAFKIGMEYVIIAILCVSLIGLWRNKRDYPGKVFALVAASVAVTMFSEFCFTLYVSNFGFFNFLGHIAKIASFLLLYIGLVKTGLKTPMESIFKRLSDDAELQSRTLKIGQMGGWEKHAGDHCAKCSGQFKALLGLPESVSDSDAFAFASGQRVLGDALRRQESLQEPFDIEFEAQRADGKPLWLRACGWQEASDGERQGRHFGMLQDIAKAKESERLRDEVERISRHDLKTPLNAIANLSEMMLEDTSLNETQRLHAKLINESGSRVLEMIGLSLDIFKMERGIYKPSQSELHLPHMLERAKEELRPILKAKSLSLNFIYESGAGASYVIWAESLLCHSMLCNVLRNAAEAAPAGTAIEARCSAGESSISTAVSNKGAPDPSIRLRFFEKYATYGKSSGTGLGNYSAKLIAKAFGGDIEMECSDSLNETTVTIRLPRPPDSAEQTEG